MRKIEIVKYQIENKNIPSSFDNFKILHITDLHGESFGSNNCELMDKIVELNPDMIVITGDMIVDLGNDYTETIRFLNELSNRYETYSVFGNHEQEALCSVEGLEFYKGYFKELMNTKIKHLNGESFRVYRGDEYINIYGMTIPLVYYPHGVDCLKRIKKSIDKSTLVSMFEGINEKEFNIALIHNPLFFKDYVKKGIDVIFSGHVHGGMIRIPGIGGLLSPTRRFFPKYDLGEYKENCTTMIVSKGLGGGGSIPRIFCNPEVVMVTIKRINKGCVR